jgi:hypothetical protein
MAVTERVSDVVQEALAITKQATELRAAAITELLMQREQIEEDLKALGYVPPRNGHGGPTRPESGKNSKPNTRFRDLALAQVVYELLSHHDQLHGTEIERLAREGGFRGGTNNFQNYLPMALKRAGGFENLGRNTWMLNPAIKPEKKEG